MIEHQNSVPGVTLSVNSVTASCVHFCSSDAVNVTVDGVSMVTELALQPVSEGFVYKALSKRCVTVHSPFLQGPHTSPLSTHFSQLVLTLQPASPSISLAHGLEKACFSADRASILDSHAVLRVKTRHRAEIIK